MRVETERAQLVERLVQRLDKNQTEALLHWSFAYRAGQLRYADFYKSLQSLCRTNGVDLEQYPAVAAYIRYVLLADRIDAEHLFSEMTEAERIAYARLAKTPEEKALVRESHRLAMTEKLIDFSLTPTEWTEYEETKKGGSVHGDLDAFESFYREAHARDQAMADNFLKPMARPAKLTSTSGGRTRRAKGQTGS